MTNPLADRIAKLLEHQKLPQDSLEILQAFVETIERDLRTKDEFSLEDALLAAEKKLNRVNAFYGSFR